MREIKFRAWGVNDENPHGRMYYPGDLPVVINMFGDPIHAPSGNKIEDCCYMRVGWNDVDIMQYTGLKDKNGKEIYEGDIVKFIDHDRNMYKDRPSERGQALVRFGKNPAIGSTKVSGYTFGWYLELTKAKVNKKLSGFMRGLDVSSMEIIGNIYENPELLSL